MQEQEPSKNKINEPLEQYFQSPAFLKSFKKITFSTPEEQDEANREFCLSLKPEQRLEYLQYLNSIFIPEYSNIPQRFESKIHFAE